MNTKVL